MTLRRCPDLFELSDCFNIPNKVVDYRGYRWIIGIPE